MGIKNAITRYGAEQIARQIPFVETVCSYDSAQEAAAVIAGDAAAFLLLSLRETLHLDEDIFHERDAGGPKILSLIDVPDVAEVADAIDLRRDGFLSMNDFTVDTLADSIVRVQQGEIPIPSELTRALLANARPRTAKRPHTDPVYLTQRERETLGLLVHGLSNKQMATRLMISEHGVKRLVTNVLAKLNAPNRTTAVARALREQLCVAKDMAQS